jgi:dipeptidase D
MQNKTLDLFYQISAVPRGTKYEQKIRQWLVDWAEGRDLTWKTDAAGNMFIYVPGSAKGAGKAPIILQSHMDMVCQKTPESTHDFTCDPIIPHREGDWLKADGTTLGADNGIGMALALDLACDESLAHPPLELVFTVEEEQGVVGATRIDATLLHGKTLINLDSEEEGTLTVGCAGGATSAMHLPLNWEQPGAGDAAWELVVGGLAGGHSADDISLARGNAIKLAARILNTIRSDISLRLASIDGGSARNAIPRDTKAVFTCSAAESAACREAFNKIAAIIQAEYRTVEPAMKIKLNELHTLPDRVARLDDSLRALRLLIALPNGVSAYSSEIPDFVETSNNVGVVETDAEGLRIMSLQRSSIQSKLDEITARIDAAALLAGASLEPVQGYSPWTPNFASPLLERCKRVYAALSGKQPSVHVSQGGLECGIISERCGGLDTISLGPTMNNLHSPDECLYLPSIEPVRHFLADLLASF